MIWLALLLLLAVCLVPLALALRGAARVRNRRDAAIAHHRAQLAELDRDLADGRILSSEHEAAKLEIARRLLADDKLAEPAGAHPHAWPVLATAAAIPVLAFALYRIGGHPELAGAAPPPPETADAAAARDDALITELRGKLAAMDPHGEQTRRGYELLGRAELSRGNLPGASDAWRRALAIRFDPTLAAETAEVLTEESGGVTPDAAALFRHALAAAPADAPWRGMVERRLSEAGKS